MKNKILVYHPTGNQNVRALLRALQRSNMLHTFHTTIAVFKSSFYYNLFSIKFLSKLKRRTFPDEIKKQTILYPFLEILLGLGIKKYKGKELTGSLINKLLSYKVATYISKTNKIEKLFGLYGYPYGSLPLFHEAKKKNIICFYELTTGYYKELKKITQHEKLINPEWASSIKIYEEDDEILHKLDDELNLADCIIVASTYIKTTLLAHNYPANKIHIIPYGFPNIVKRNYRTITNKIKILYAGNISQLKGLSYMFKALDSLSDKVELSLAGSISDTNCKPLMMEIRKHKYLGALSHDILLKEMRTNDILLFPSLCDGYGLVINEAMSQGLPVIASYNSGGPDVITHGINGWLVPHANSNEITKILSYIIDHPEEIERVGKNAIITASLRPWNKYEHEIIKLLKSYNKNN